uniref:Cation efflux system protein CusC n=1 Tax=Klebsiella pneumoniae TaxID=573 RepID=A0A8B0SWU7_KLEPN|nr:Cation efflux system protein CusC precursor [Klebsiella pneumoniae]
MRLIARTTFASEEARRAVHILLVSNVSQSYFSQQLAYEQLRIARETLKKIMNSPMLSLSNSS